MGINFGGMPSIATTQAAPAAAPTATVAEAPVIQEVTSPTGGITLDLSKRAILDLTKRNPGLSKCVLAAGWDAAAAGAAGIDLDITAIMLNENGKITSGDDIVYFNNKVIPGVKLNKDNRTGDGEGDDETIDLDLALVDPKYTEIVFVINIFEAAKNKQTFGMVQNSYVRLLDKAENDKELCRFRLKDNYATSTAVIFAKLKRDGSDWQFEAIGEGKVVRDLNDIAAIYL